MSTYYVATTGNDSTGDGSISTPWRTIQKGCDNLSAGDTLYIRGGTYNEHVNMTKSGTSGSRITIKAYTGETVILDGEYQLPRGTYKAFFDNNPDNSKIGPDTWRLKTGEINYEFAFQQLFDINANYVTLEDIRITRARGHAVGSSIAGVTGVEVKNCELWDTRQITVHFYTGATDTILDGLDIRRGGNFAPFSRGGATLNWGACISDSGNIDTVIKNCTIFDTWNEGIVCGTGATVQDCIVANTWSTAIYAQKAEDLTIERNLIFQSDDSDQLATGRGSAGIAISAEPWGTPNAAPNANIRIRNNIIVGYQQAIAFRTAGDTIVFKDIHVCNNTFVDCRNPVRTATYFVWGSRKATLEDVKIFNNVIYHNTAMGNTDVEASDYATTYPNTNGTGVTFSYNLWQGVTPPAWMQGTGDVTNGAGLYRPNSAIPHVPLGSATYQSGAVANNYYISDSESLAIDAGTATDAPSDDYAGNTRTGTIDIGAHEYGATSIPSGVTADFSASTTSGTGQLTVQFFDASSGTPTSWAWQYKEAADSAYTWFSSAENPVRTFEAGTYSIRLTVADASTSDTKTRAGYIIVSASTGDEGSGTPGGGSGVTVATVGADYSSASTGDQAVSYINADLTPTAALWAMCGATSEGSAADDAILGWGVTDGTNSHANSAAAEHGQGTIANDTKTGDGVLIWQIPGTLTTDGQVAHGSFAAGAQTINWSKVDATSRRMIAMAFAATNAAAGYCTPSASVAGTVNITPGFTPDAIIFLPCGTNYDAGANDYRMGAGFAVNGGNQVAVGWRYDDGTASQTNGAQIASTRSGISTNTNGTTNFATEVTTWGSTTVLTTRDSGNGSAWETIWLALELENGVWCDIIDTPTSTGTQAYTGVGFRPGAIIIVGTMLAAEDTATTNDEAGSHGMGFWSSDGSEYCVTAQVENGAATSNAQSYANAKIMDLPQDDGTAGITAVMSSADADGFTLNFTATLGTARKWLVFALEDGSVFIPDFVKTGTTRGMVAGLP